MAVDQSQIFREGEGDNWFRRNAEHLSADGRDDVVLRAIERAVQSGTPLQSVCELGCSNGWRLAALSGLYPAIGRLAGCDVSEQAIADGVRKRDAQGSDVRGEKLGFDEAADGGVGT